ncbi:MAG: amidophosphoribosyltransferase [Hyphomicrobiales bacterium]|nr:amidophosphoribosyltransferase [Hyphomicrobiales bacterium]
MSEDLRENCGVFGIFDHEDASALTALGLHALQHRGQEAVGIVSFDGSQFFAERKLGLVGDHFSNPNVIARLSGSSAIGHVRYATTGNTALRNIQPLFADLWGGGLACAHNGNLTNSRRLRSELVRAGAIFQSTSDTETILQLIARDRSPRTIERLIGALHQIEGAFALVFLTTKKLIGVRDPHGIRPLVLGNLNGAPILTSETCALDIIGAKFEREIDPGEVVVITEDGIESLKPFQPKHPRPCIFERIYFARPDSIVDGKSIYDYRHALGRELAQETSFEADVVIPVPDSGVPAAIGYAITANLPFELGIIRNHYVGRTFIQPTQKIRELGVRLKHNINRSRVNGKRVVLIDDSIVRGTTSVKLVRMMYEAGAKEVHLCVASPPICYPDFYGIDTPLKEELLASRYSLDEMRNFIGADSLTFLSLEGMYRAMGMESRNVDRPQFADHCFTGDYPTRLVDETYDRHQDQLSLLTESA